MKNYFIRKADNEEIVTISNLFYEALTNIPEFKKIGKEATLAKPELGKYIVNLGKEDDIIFIAQDNDNKIVGAAWSRIFKKENPGYGYIADDIPELSVSVTQNARNKGVGTELLKQLLEEAKEREFRAVSLSVSRENDSAIHVYEKLGFKYSDVTKPEDTSKTLIRYL